MLDSSDHLKIISVGLQVEWTSQVALVVKLSANEGDVRDGFNHWDGKIPGGGHGNPVQYSCLENPKGRGAWQATVQRVAQSQTQLK